MTDKSGLVSFLIPYGKYLITQNSTILDYELMPDYEIFVENSNEETLTFINYKKPDHEETPEEIPDIPDDLEKPKEETFPETETKEPTKDKEEIYGNNEILSDENIENDLTKEEVNTPQDETLNNEENNLENSNDVVDEKNSKEHPVIENPETKDGFLNHLTLLLISTLILGKILRKMQ